MIEVIATPTTLARVVRRLDNVEPLLKRMGLLMRSESGSAFDRQSFDGKAWEPCYPGQAAPHVNVAGVLSDLNAGRNPPKRRFQRSPANVDTNTLRRSLAFRVHAAGQSVEVGSWLEYAGRAHGGGTTDQPVTSQARRGLKMLLRRKPELRPKLAFLFHTDTLTTSVTARPFVGVTKQTAPMLTAAAERYFAGAA